MEVSPEEIEKAKSKNHIWSVLVPLIHKHRFNKNTLKHWQNRLLEDTAIYVKSSLETDKPRFNNKDFQNEYNIRKQLLDYNLFIEKLGIWNKWRFYYFENQLDKNFIYFFYPDKNKWKYFFKIPVMNAELEISVLGELDHTILLDKDESKKETK